MKTTYHTIDSTYLNVVGIISAIQVNKADSDIEMKNFPVIDAISLPIPKAGQREDMYKPFRVINANVNT